MYVGGLVVNYITFYILRLQLLYRASTSKMAEYTTQASPSFKCKMEMRLYKP